MTDHDHAALAAAVEQAELEAQITARRSDLAAGRVPADVRRALYVHELHAQTNFAAIETDTRDAAAPITQRLTEDRAALLELLAVDLQHAADRGGPDAPNTRIAARLIDLSGPDGLHAITGTDLVITEAERFHRGRLEVAVDDGLRAVLAEAQAQGLDVTLGVLKLDAGAAEHLDLIARRLAIAPHADLLNALRDRALVDNRGFVTPDAFIAQLRTFADTLSANVLVQQAEDATAQANGIGRLAAVDQVPAVPVAVYASELLDRTTCGPCSLVDGRAYPDADAARIDYPAGTYVHCEGGARCRGTTVAVWASETPATLPEPARAA